MHSLKRKRLERKMKIKHVVSESSDGDIHMIYGYTGLNFWGRSRTELRIGKSSVYSQAIGKEDLCTRSR